MSETGFLQLCNFFSQDATFTKVYNSTPHVFVSANHSTKNGSQSPIHNSIAEWVEVCFISLFTCLFFPFFMNFCNIPLATTVTCGVCMFKNLMKIRMTIINTLSLSLSLSLVLLSITAYKIYTKRAKNSTKVKFYPFN